MPAARQPSGSSVSDTSAMAMPKSVYSREGRELTLRDCSKPRSSLMRFGSPLSKRSTAAFDALTERQDVVAVSSGWP